MRGARFNPKGLPTLYLALTIMTAVKEANQGLAYRIDPCVLCSYDVDCEDIVDLRTTSDREGAGIDFDDMASAWMNFLAEGKRPPSWGICERLISDGAAGILSLASRRAPALAIRIWCCGAGAKTCLIGSRWSIRAAVSRAIRFPGGDAAPGFLGATRAAEVARCGRS